DRWFKATWEPLRSNLDYHALCADRRGAGANTGVKQGRVFPHPMNGGESRPAGQYYQALCNSPFGNELVVELARGALESEELGRRESTDLLCLSFSSNDLVGHCWGPDSPEVLDTTLRSDFVIRDLLALLDRQVGEGRYVVALSADHGVCPLPEVSRA